MKLSKLKLFLVLPAAVILLSAAHCQAQDTAAGKKIKARQYYSFLVTYSSADNSVKLAADKKYPPIVGPANFTKDSGVGSTFYAKLIDADNKYRALNGVDKFYLGNWSQEGQIIIEGVDKEKNPTKTVEKPVSVNVKVSVPYFPGGKTIEIYDAKTNKLALSVDVAKFAQASPVKTASVIPQLKKSSAIGQIGMAIMAKMKIWLMPILIILGGIILGVVVFLIRRRKMKKEIASLSGDDSQSETTSSNIRFK